MHPLYLFQHFQEAVIYVATRSPVVIPFWAAVGWLFLLIARRPILKIICSLFGITNDNLEIRIISRIDAPLQVLLVLVAISPFLGFLPAPWGHRAIKFVQFVAPLTAWHLIIQSFDSLCFGWYLREKKGVDVPPVFRAVLMGLLYLAVILHLLDWVFGINVLPLLATSTVIAAVLGLALQDTLRNVFAGLTLGMERSLNVGDWILCRQGSTKDLIGQIVEIGWRSTKIHTVNSNYAIIPNSQFTNYELINFSSPTLLQAVQIEFPIGLDAQPAMVRTALEEAAAANKDVLEMPKPQAMPLEIKSNHVLYQLQFYVNGYEKRDQVKGSVIERAWQKLAALGALPK
jgi:small-conductance mechanosensitive channel